LSDYVNFRVVLRDVLDQAQLRRLGFLNNVQVIVG